MVMRRDVRIPCNQGRLKEALNLLHVMDQPDSNTYVSLLDGCVNRKSLREGRLLHGHMIHTGFNLHTFSGTKLVIMYAKCGNVMDARRAFDELPKPNVVSWNVMIAANGKHGCRGEALALFYQMQQTGTSPDHFTFSSVLAACANSAALEHGKKIHGDIINRGFLSNIFVRNALIDMYAKCGRIEYARHVFDKMPERNVVSWTAMIAGYAQNGDEEEALKFFEKMPERNVVSWSAMIAGYTQNGHIDEALKLFQKIHKRDVVLWTTMIAGYTQNGDVEKALNLFQKIPQRDVVSWNAMIAGCAQNEHVDEARKLFQKMPERDVVSWNALIAGYAQNGYADEALKLFQKMSEPDTVSWNAIIAGYAQSGYVYKALKLFQEMPERDVVSWNAMLAGYAQNGKASEALKFFQKIPERDGVSWASMIAGYVRNGYCNEALKLFRQMQRTVVKPAVDTFSSVLPACAHLSALKHGRELHGNIIRSGFQNHIFVGSALVDMYAKCGSIEHACHVFYKMPERNVVSWNAMIVGYATHGCGKEALQLFEQMQQSCTKPDHITFVGVLSACCHAGLVDNGWQYFDRMNRDYDITPTVEHYGCMVDLLGRAGRLEEAHDFINRMPIKPSAAVWGCLFGACRIYTNVELGERVAEHLFELEPENAANYVLMSNIYAAAGRWDDVDKLQQMRKNRRLKKSPGCTWIEINNKVHSFIVRDRSHPQTHRIYAELERLSSLMKEAGYVPDTNLVVHDMWRRKKGTFSLLPQQEALV